MSPSKINSLSPADKIRLFHYNKVIKAFNRHGELVPLDDINKGESHSLVFQIPVTLEDQDIILIQKAEAEEIRERVK